MISTADLGNFPVVRNDIVVISMSRKNAVANYSESVTGADMIKYTNLHYNNGVTEYNENWTFL
jgi:hypothetical protein